MRLILLLLPWLELWSLIELGASIGALQALGYVFLTMMLGIWLIRRQGEGMLLRIREEFDGQVIINPALLADGLVMVFCGLLLVVPGLITDLVGVLLMIGPLRRILLKRHKGADAQASITIEGEFNRLDD